MTQKKKKGDCITTDTLMYSWFMPELLLAAQWAGEEWLRRLLATGLSIEDKIRGMHKGVFGTEDPSRKDLFMFDVITGAFFNDVLVCDMNLRRKVYTWFPEIKELARKLETERPDELLTGTPMIGNDWDLSEYIRNTLRDLIEKHVEDINKVMGESYDGGVDCFIGSTFVLKTSEKVLRCELENLAFSGSVFNCNGIKIRMLPILIG